MTTIAFDGKTMAADGRLSAGGIIFTDSAAKIHRLETNRWTHTPAIVGLAGDDDCVDLVLKWLESDDAESPDIEHPNGEWSALVWDGESIVQVSHDRLVRSHWENHACLGPGRHFALAAMRAGADAHRAVEVAISMDVYSGGKITTMELTG